MTVMVYVADWGADNAPLVFTLPHPLSKPSPIAPTAISGRTWTSRRLFQPMQHTTAASALSGINGLAGRRFDVIEAVVVTVSVVEAAPPEGVTVAGAKLHVAPEGSPEQLNEIGELKPYAGVTEIEVVPFCAPVTVCDAGVAATEKSGGMVYVALATALVE